ncbi:MAG: M48 family metallopeptidase [Ardenticatenaceae bacterium]|nr:M48 family metallopeptidase [Ardenticatenaceae bacterium]
MADSPHPQDAWPVEIVRSERRRKTVNAKIRNGVLVVQAPAHLSDGDLAPIIKKLQTRLKRKIQPVPQTDDELEKRAQELNKAYFDGALRWQSIRYVTNQNKRYGSCTPANGTIRLSHRLATMPAWVRDYVIVHELAHLLEPNHSANFWELVNRYPLTERARGYLMALDLEIIAND